MKYAFLESGSGDVWSVSSQDLSISDVDTRTGLTQIDEKIDDAPDQLIARGSKQSKFHRKIEGDGTSISDYSLIDNPDYVTPVTGEIYETSLDERQTTSNSAEDVLVITTPKYPSGSYVVEWYAEIKTSKTNN